MLKLRTLILIIAVLAFVPVFTGCPVDVPLVYCDHCNEYPCECPNGNNGGEPDPDTVIVPGTTTVEHGDIEFNIVGGLTQGQVNSITAMINGLDVAGLAAYINSVTFDPELAAGFEIDLTGQGAAMMADVTVARLANADVVINAMNAGRAQVQTARQPENGNGNGDDNRQLIAARGGIRFYAEEGTSEETRAAIMGQIDFLQDWFIQIFEQYVLRWTHRAGDGVEIEIDPVTGRAIIYSNGIDVSGDFDLAVEYMRGGQDFEGEIVPRTSNDGDTIELRVVPGQVEWMSGWKNDFNNILDAIFDILAAHISTVYQENPMSGNDGREYELGLDGRIILRRDFRTPGTLLGDMVWAVRQAFPEVEFPSLPLEFDWVMNHDLRDTDFVDWDGSTNQGRLVNVSIERGNNNITPDEIREMIENFDDQSFLAERSAWLVYLRFVSSVPSDAELSGPGVGVNEVRSWTWEVFIDGSLSLRDSLNAAHQLIHNDLWP